MSGLIACGERGRAASYIHRLNMAIVHHCARQRQRHGNGEGARSPIGMAATPTRLETIVEASPAGGSVPVTPLGYLTAVRAMPRILAALPRSDPRRQAADMLAVAYERIGSVQGGTAEGGDTKGGQSDGGVTTRVKHAERLRLIEAAANFWPIDRQHGTVTIGRELVVMPIKRKRGNRQEIKAFPLLVALCVDGQDLADILRANGWTVHSKHSRPLGIAALHILGRIADAVASDSPPHKKYN